MIRAVAITSLVTLLMLVLYLPSSRPPVHFVAQLKSEHERTQAFWGAPTAERIFDRMLTLQDEAQPYSPVPAATNAPSSNAMASEVAQEMARVNARLFNNGYFRSIDAMLALATYRLATLLEWVAPSWVVAAALILDALLERSRKAKEFRSHRPELFAVYASLATFVACGCMLAFAWPWTLPPILWSAPPAAIALAVARAICHFPRTT